MAMPSTLSHNWVCPGALIPGLGPRLLTFRRGFTKLRASGAPPRPAGFAGFIRLSRPSSGSISGRRFSVPPERAPGAKPSSTTRPSEFTAWVYHALGVDTLITIMSIASFFAAVIGIQVSLAFQQTQTTGVLPVVGWRAQQADASAAFSEVTDDRQQGETASASKPMSRSATTAEVVDTDDHDTGSEPLASTAVRASTASTRDMAYRVVPYGMSVANDVHDTPWSNLCRWAVYALQFQDALEQQAAGAGPEAAAAAASEASASMVSEQAEMETAPASDADVTTETADGIRNPAATVGVALRMGGSTVEPQVLSHHDAELGSIIEVRTTSRRTMPVVRVARALLRLSAHAAELPLRIVDWALQMDQPIRFYRPHVTALSTTLRAPVDAIATPTVAEAEAEAGTEAAATSIPVQSAAPRITPLEACVNATPERHRHPFMSVSDEAVVTAQRDLQQQQQQPEKKGRDPWDIAAEAVEESAFGLETLEPEMAAEMRSPARDVMTFARAAGDAATVQLRVHDEASGMGEQAGGEKLTPAAVARLRGGGATAVFAVALSSWLLASAIVLLSRAVADAMVSTSSTSRAGAAGAFTGPGMSTQEYFGPWYNYVRRMWPPDGYPGRTCVPFSPLHSHNPQLDIPAAVQRKEAESAPVTKLPSIGDRAGSSSSGSSTLAVDHKQQQQQVPLAQSEVAAVAALDKDVQALATAVVEPQREPHTELVAVSDLTRAYEAASNPSISKKPSAGISGSNLEDMAGLLRLLPPPPSRRGWAASPAAAAGFKPNPPVLTDPTTYWGITPSSAAAAAAEAAAAAVAAAATEVAAPRGKRDLPQDQRRARPRKFSDRLREAMERRITAAAAAAAATTSLPAATPDSVEPSGPPTAAAVAGTEAEAASPAQADCPGGVTPEVGQFKFKANSIPSTPGCKATAWTAVAAEAEAAEDDDAAEAPHEAQDDGANWQLGPACELAVPLAVPFAVPLAVPVPPAVPLPLSAAELAAPPLPSVAKGANPPAAAGLSELPSLQVDSTRALERQSVPLDVAESSVALVSGARATEASGGGGSGDGGGADLVSTPGPEAEARGHATLKSVVSVPGLHLSTTIRQPGTALVIRYQPPLQQQKISNGLIDSADTAAQGCCGNASAGDPDPSYEEQLRDVIKPMLSDGGAHGAAALTSEAEVLAGPSEQNRKDIERRVKEAGLTYAPMMEWCASSSPDVEPDGSESGNTVPVTGPTDRPESPTVVEISVERADRGEESATSGDGSCLLPAVVSRMERGIVKAGLPAAPGGVVVRHRSPVTRGSLHSQTVTVTIDADAVHGVNNVQVDVKPSMTATMSAVEAALPRAGREGAANPGVLPPSLPPAAEAPWVLAAPAVTPPAALLPAASRPASPLPVSAPEVQEQDQGAQTVVRSAALIPAAAAAAAVAALKASGEDLTSEAEESLSNLTMTDGTAVVSAAPLPAMVEASGCAELQAAGAVEWAFYAGQYNGMTASELRPYHAPGEWQCGHVEEAPRAVTAAAPGPDGDVVEGSGQGLLQGQGVEDITPESAGVKVDQAIRDGTTSTGTAAAAAAAAACDEVLGNGLFNHFVGVPELDRALVTSGGVVPCSWMAAGTVKVEVGIEGDGAAKKAPNAAAPAAADVAAGAAAAAAATAPSGPTTRRGLFGSRRRRASLLRLRSEVVKAAAVGAVRAANAAAASTLFGVRVDEMFSTYTQDSGGAAAKDANFDDQEYTDDVLNALAALAAAASGAAIPARVQPAATALAATTKVANAEGVNDQAPAATVESKAAATDGSVSRAPQLSTLSAATAAAVTVSLAAAPSLSTQAAATPEVDQNNMTDQRARAELAIAASGATTHEVSGMSAAVLIATATTAAEVPHSSQAASMASHVAAAARDHTGSALDLSPAEHLEERIDAESDITGGRHFLPLASAVAMFNRPRIPPASLTAATAAAAAAASITRTDGAEASAAAAWMLGRDDAASRKKEMKEKRLREGKVAAGGAVADLPSLAAVSSALPPAGSLAATALGLGVAAAAAGAAVVHASESLEKLEDIDDASDLQAQSVGLVAAAANGVVAVQTAAASISAIETPADSQLYEARVTQEVLMDAEPVEVFALNVGRGGQQALGEGGGTGGEENDDVESQLRPSVYVRPEIGWDLDLDLELRCGFTGPEPEQSPVGGAPAATAPLAIWTPTSDTPVVQAAVTSAVSELSAAKMPLASPKLATGDAEAAVKSKKASSVAAGVEEEEEDEDEEMEALRWLADLMGVAIEGFTAAENQPWTGPGTEEKSLKDCQQAPPSADASTSASDVSIAGLSKVTDVSTAAVAVAAASALAAPVISDASDVEIVFGETTVILPEAPVDQVPGSLTTPVVAAAAALAAPPPQPAPYTSYWSVPDAGTLEGADVDAFAASKSSQEDEDQGGAVRSGEDNATSSDTASSWCILERGAQSALYADIDIYPLFRSAARHKEVAAPGSDPTDVLLRFLLDVNHAQRDGEAGIDEGDDELQFGYYPEEDDDDGYLPDFDEDIYDADASEDGGRL